MQKLLASLLTAFACLNASAQNPVRDMANDPATAKISVFKNEKGDTITEAEFFQAMDGGKPVSYSKKSKDGQLIEVEFRLVDPAQLKKQGPAVNGVRAGETLPAFALKSANGADYSNATLSGKTTLVNFSFAGCAPCVKEVPYLNAFAAAHPDIQVVSITFDSAKESLGFIEKTGFTWPQLVDAREYLNKLGVRAYPAFVLIDGSGKLLADGTNIGYREGKFLLDEWVTTTLKK